MCDGEEGGRGDRRALRTGVRRRCTETKVKDEANAHVIGAYACNT